MSYFSHSRRSFSVSARLLCPANCPALRFARYSSNSVPMERAAVRPRWGAGITPNEKASAASGSARMAVASMRVDVLIFGGQARCVIDEKYSSKPLQALRVQRYSMYI